MEQNVCIYMACLAGEMRQAGKDSKADLFRAMSIPFTRNIRQEFSIVVTIDGDNISVSFAGVSDREDGKQGYCLLANGRGDDGSYGGRTG